MKKNIFVKIIVILLVFSFFLFVACSDNNSKKGIVNYVVSFEENGGSSVQSKSIKYLTSPPYTTKQNYLFDGWYLDSTLKNAASYPLEINNDITLYAKWIKTRAYSTLGDKDIKFNIHLWEITPNGFDLQRLSELEYYLVVTVNYSVYYKKDYDMLWDIGYLGAPEYEVSLMDEKGYGQHYKKIVATKNEKTNQIISTYTANELINGDIYFQISSDNIQNKIYFKNINISYEWMA